MSPVHEPGSAPEKRGAPHGAVVVAIAVLVGAGSFFALQSCSTTRAGEPGTPPPPGTSSSPTPPASTATQPPVMPVVT